MWRQWVCKISITFCKTGPGTTSCSNAHVPWHDLGMYFFTLWRGDLAVCHIWGKKMNYNITSRNAQRSQKLIYLHLSRLFHEDFSSIYGTWNVTLATLYFYRCQWRKLCFCFFLSVRGVLTQKLRKLWMNYTFRGWLGSILQSIEPFLFDQIWRSNQVQGKSKTNSKNQKCSFHHVYKWLTDMPVISTLMIPVPSTAYWMLFGGIPAAANTSLE